MTTMLTNIELDDTAKACIDCLKELIMKENREENAHLGTYDLYETYCSQIEKALFDGMGKALWQSYQNMRTEESDFFDPYEAYLAGREAKLDGEMNTDIAYKFYLEKIKNSERYQKFKKGEEVIFKDLSHYLASDYLRDRLSKVDQLYKRLYAPFEKNLWIFFNLGYDCCPA